jgi:DNA-binding MurR/RpiR family transcriptional regulator
MWYHCYYLALTIRFYCYRISLDCCQVSSKEAILLPEGVREFRTEKVNDLAPAERGVIKFMLESGPESLMLSARELGQQAGTSGVTVVRAAKALGYAKLGHLRLALADYRSGQSEPRLDDRFDATLESAANGLLAKEIEVASRSLDALRSKISLDEFERAVEILDRSQRIAWRGVGPSGFLAEYAALLSQRIGHPSIAITRMGTELADELLSLQPKDALVVLSYGPLQVHTQVILDLAKKSDVILITDVDTSELARLVTMVIECGRGAPRHFQSHAVTLLLIESLILGVAGRSNQRRKRSLAKLNDLREEIAGRPLPVDTSQSLPL